MPKFEINEKNRVLVNIPSGKNYISHPDEFIDQRSQKEGTCWYYVLNYLRPRYGKAVDRLIKATIDIKEIREDKDYIALAKGRRVEKLISVYRKRLSALDTIQEVHTSLLRPSHQFIQECSKTQKQKRIELANQLALDLHGPSFAKEFSALNKQMGDTVCKLTQLISENKSEDMGLAMEAEKSHNLIVDACRISYDLSVSSWRPQLGFAALLDSLRQVGGLAVTGRFGNHFYHSPPKKSLNLMGSRTVYYWNPGDRITEKVSLLHEILVIGAEEVNNKGYVYYLDPNDDSIVSGERCSYKISYDRFASAVVDIAGMKTQVELSKELLALSKSTSQQLISSIVEKNIKILEEKGIFAYYGDEQKIPEAQQQYARVMQRIGDKYPDIYQSLVKESEKNVHGSASSDWVKSARL